MRERDLKSDHFIILFVTTAGDYSDLSSEMINFIDDTYKLVFMEMEQLLARHEAKQNVI